MLTHVTVINAQPTINKHVHVFPIETGDPTHIVSLWG